MDFTLYNTQLKSFIQWLLPSTCQDCGQKCDSDTLFCLDCESKLPRISNGCKQCGQPIPNAHTSICGRCLSSPPHHDSCFSPFEFSRPLADHIRRLKYQDSPQTSRRLAKLFLKELDGADLMPPEALVYVPLHSRKLRSRGYNQAHQLAKAISIELEIPIIKGAIVKTKSTPDQASQTLSQRRANLIGCFKINKPIPFKHVAIIDDVITSGATVEEISKILKKNGVDYLQVWSIARTP